MLVICQDFAKIALRNFSSSKRKIVAISSINLLQ